MAKHWTWKKRAFKLKIQQFILRKTTTLYKKELSMAHAIPIP